MLVTQLKQLLLNLRKGRAMQTFGINGFGRIGRTAVRVWWQKHRSELDLKLINTSGSMDVADWAHLLKYDTNYGKFSAAVEAVQTQSKKDVTDENPVLGKLIISEGGDKHEITITAQRDPAKIPWGTQGVNVVVESTGVFTTAEKAAAHLTAGAKQVIISAPAKGDGISMAVIGVNDFDATNPIRSNASCTTNCIAPVAKVMLEQFGVEKAMLNTIHAYTDDQNLQDNSHKDLRRARSGAENICPTSTGAAKAVGSVIPELKGVFDGLSVRVPVAVGSLSDMVFVTKRAVTVEEINQALIAASKTERWQNILAVTDEPLVSSDIVGRSESSIVDLSLTQVVGGNLVRVISWYDNEFGYCNRLIEQVAHS
jgi:glyceraldehyde 3-phosphate dehydrogenase